MHTIKSIKKTTLNALARTVWAGALCLAAQAHGAPQLQFDQTLFDFGKTSRVATVSGVFKFKNIGDATLKLDPPKPSCGCTVAELKPDTLAPGATGELPFTLVLGTHRAVLEKHISVRSNDPKTPEVSLSIRVDYTPLYELDPQTLAPSLAFGVNDADLVATLTRTDGKPLHITRLDSSRPWITAKLEPGAGGDATTARIRVAVKRDGSPRRFNEFVQIYTDQETNTPASSIYLYGQMMGQLALAPEALYWSLNDQAKQPGDNLEGVLTRKLTVRSANGEKFILKNPQSSIKGLKVQLTPKEAGKTYELVARLDEAPTSTVSGNVSFETSVAAQPRIEVPFVVNVFKQ